MSFIEYNQSYIFSFAPENGAQNRSPTGDSFSIQLTQPIQVPKEAVNATLEVTQADIWNTVPNISAHIGNNKFRVYFYDVYAPQTWTITIPCADGLYSVGALNALLSREFVN